MSEVKPHPLPNYHLKTEFRIGKPSGKYKAFRIQYRSPSTDNNWTQLNLPEITLANNLFKSQTHDADHTFDKLKIILAQQYAHRDRKKKKPAFMKGNMALIEKMWEEKYNKRKQRSMKRPEDSWRELVLAVEACGLFPLDTCDLDELADYLDENLATNQNLLARRITWINSILQWHGRNKLTPTKRVRLRVKYLNEDEFLSVVGQIRDETTQTLAHIAFYTGARLGEIFFIQPQHIKKHSLFLELQMTDTRTDGKGKRTKLGEKTYKEDTLKNGNSREVFYPDVVKPFLKKWAAVSFKERYKIREKSFCKAITRSCKKIFEDNDPIKILNFHDLRHSNAIWLLQKGASITEVAQQLGNSPEVCYTYYSGWELKKESIERLRSLAN